LLSDSLSGVYCTSGQQRYILPPTPRIVITQTVQGRIFQSSRDNMLQIESIWIDEVSV